MDDWPVSKSRLAFWTVGSALAAVVGFVVYRFVGTFVFGVFIYYATRPVYRRLRRRVHQPSIAAAGALLLLALPALLLMGYAFSIGVAQLDRFLANGNVAVLNSYLTPLVDVSTLIGDPEQLLASGGMDAVQRVLREAGSLLGSLALLVLHVFLMFAIAFYLLRDDHRLARWFRIRFSDEGGVVEEYFRAVDRDLHSVFFGNILNAVLTGTIGVIVYSTLDFFAPPGMGVPYAALLGLLAGVASLIPIVGMKLVYFPVGAYLFALPYVEGLSGVWWFPVAFVLLSLVVVDTIPDLVLRPYVSGRTLHVGMVMVAYVLGPLLFGWYGIFLAPLLLVLVIHFARIVLPELLVGKPIQPYAVDPSYLTDPPVAATDDGSDGTEPDENEK